MSRYIDADEAIEAVEQVVWDDYFWKDIEKAIKKMPTADVRENVHGEWVIDGEYIDCSVCRQEKWSRVPFEELVKRFKYCPNCGADMRGKKDD